MKSIKCIGNYLPLKMDIFCFYTGLTHRRVSQSNFQKRLYQSGISFFAVPDIISNFRKGGAEKPSPGNADKRRGGGINHAI